MPEERLQKILSRAGVSSRRHAEEMIVEGRVKVNGKVVTELGTKADFARDHIKVDGKLLHAPKSLVYLMLNKPKGVVTTVTDPQGRDTVMELIRGVKERVFPVGRLDYASEGLLLFTNDGEFANRVTRAATHVPKVYVVKTNAALTRAQEEEFESGVVLEGRRTAPAKIKRLRSAAAPWYEITLIEGRHRQIRDMFRHFRVMVEKLKRVRIGFLELGDLPSGQFRHLTPREVSRFRTVLKMEPDSNG